MKRLSLPLLAAIATFAGLSCSCEREANAAGGTAAEPDVPANVENLEYTADDTGDVVPTRKPYQPETEEELRARLSDIQFQVTKHEGTERAYTGKYDKHYEEGIYVCIISGEALFSSKDKYDSGCGWPAFTKPIDAEEIEQRTDYKIGYARTEVRAKTGDSHLGHVFKDGPAEAGGLRYCINSASLRFVPKDKLVEEGYGKYVGLFQESSK